MPIRQRRRNPDLYEEEDMEILDNPFRSLRDLDSREKTLLAAHSADMVLWFLSGLGLGYYLFKK